MNLAPVVDVPTFPGAFIWQEGRAFSFSANLVARIPPTVSCPRSCEP